MDLLLVALRGSNCSDILPHQTETIKESPIRFGINETTHRATAALPGASLRQAQ